MCLNSKRGAVFPLSWLHPYLLLFCPPWRADLGFLLPRIPREMMCPSTLAPSRIVWETMAVYELGSKEKRKGVSPKVYL